ncbi:hypothetical protein AMS68_006190 [Peltaster fructicola]|uniref:Uncharacterized protein n=1 Tax=Peltaster fructicola TaxID=286661 RepID=A0A6H0Y0Y3_9PEZI|nr:hypothetical protein AMS68_006190 [Peltaster fructicola]
MPTKTRRIRTYGCTSINIRDGGRFARIIDDQIRTHPGEPLIIAINGHQPWLGEILSTRMEDYWQQISNLNRELQFSSTVQFPEQASDRNRHAPWTFLVNQINVSEVYYWSLDHSAPVPPDDGIIDIRRARLRVGVWFCAHNACKIDRRISTTLIFTRPDDLAELVVREHLFNALQKDKDLDQPREDEEGICWTFSRLHWLLTDWQNVIREVNARLEEAEINSFHRQYPVKYRTRTMHNEMARIYELKEEIRFHVRSFRKLQKLKGEVPKHEQNDSLWDDIDDTVEDLDQFEESLNTLRERFNNLLVLEFNIQSSDQSENSAFLSRIATLFIPMSFLTGLWGITTNDWETLWFAYAAVTVFAISVAFLLIYPPMKRHWQRVHYRLDLHRIVLKPRDFTMLGAELPDNVDVPSGRATHGRRKSQQVGDAEWMKGRSSLRSRVD